MKKNNIKSYNVFIKENYSAEDLQELENEKLEAEKFKKWMSSKQHLRNQDKLLSIANKTGAMFAFGIMDETSELELWVDDNLRPENFDNIDRKDLMYLSTVLYEYILCMKGW